VRRSPRAGPRRWSSSKLRGEKGVKSGLLMAANVSIGSSTDLTAPEIRSALPPKADSSHTSREVRNVPQPDSCTAAMTKRCPHSGRPAAYKARVVISSQSFGPEPRRESSGKTLAASRVQARPTSLPGNERRSRCPIVFAKALKSRSQCQVPPLVSRARRRRLLILWRCAVEMRRESRARLPCPRSRHSG
jgi:hypothetical protein